MYYDAKPIYLWSPAYSTPEIKLEIDNFLDSWLITHSMKDQIFLFHYTTLDGLKGILQNRSFWFSHISTLNDPLELQYGKAIITKVLSEFIENEDDENVKIILKDLNSSIVGFGELLHHVYVACFCEEDNLLSQWRSYTTNGGGYNLGIFINTDTQFCHDNNHLGKSSYIILRKVIYDYNEQQEIVKNYITKIISGAKNALNRFKDQEDVPDAWQPIVAIEASNVLFDIMFSLKNEVFSEEREWRLVKVSAENVNTEFIKFRERNSALIPYLNTYIYDNSNEDNFFPLQSIKYGPAFDDLSTRASLSLFLNSVAQNDNIIGINKRIVGIDGAGYYLRDNK